MTSQQSPQSRLIAALEAADFASDLQVSEGTAGVASPTRLATEWAGFTVNSSRGTHYAKVLHPDMTQLIDVQRSADASQCAAHSAAAPTVVWHDAARGVVLFEALGAEWRWAHLDDLTSASRLKALWAIKRKVHEGPVPGFARSPMADIQALRQRCIRDLVSLPTDQAWIDNCVDLAWQALQALPFNPVPLHGDGLASNVMVGADDRLCLIDFDYGGCFDPWYDVAITLNELYPFESQWRAGIVAWAGHCREADYARCRLYALINDWYWTLWGFWAGSTSTRRLEFSKLGQWTLLRCRQSLHDPRFEGWLRSLDQELA